MIDDNNIGGKGGFVYYCTLLYDTYHFYQVYNEQSGKEREGKGRENITGYAGGGGWGG